MRRRRPPQGFSPEVKAIVFDRATDVDGTMRCEKCGVDYGDVQVHHRLPRKGGGTKRLYVNQAANALALCGMCHLWVETYRAESYEQGWLVHDIPDELPEQRWVLRRDVRVELRDNGDVLPVTPQLKAVNP